MNTTHPLTTIHDYLTSQGMQIWGIFDNLLQGLAAYHSEQHHKPERTLSARYKHDQPKRMVSVPGFYVPEVTQLMNNPLTSRLEDKIVFYKGIKPQRLPEETTLLKF